HDEKLKELLGHSPLEVLVGAILGVVVAFLFKGYIQA
ncbi:MAG: divergent PAP2 family protein, partial [Cetobacterium sp.]